MPVGSTKLHDGVAFDAVRTSLRLASDAGTGLRWRDDYTAQRAVPGEEAGTWDERTGHFHVSARGWPLYARHAVWMLANSEPLPRGYEVVHADKDRRNLDPFNLVLVEAVEAKRQMFREAGAKMNRHDAVKKHMPVSLSMDFRLEWDADKGPNPTYDPSMPYLVTVEVWQKNNKKPLHIFNASSIQKAAVVAAYTAALFGYINAEAINTSVLTDEEKQMVIRACAVIWKNSRDELTPQMKEIGQQYVASIKTAVAAVAEELSGRFSPDGSGEVFPSGSGGA